MREMILFYETGGAMSSKGFVRGLSKSSINTVYLHNEPLALSVFTKPCVNFPSKGYMLLQIYFNALQEFPRVSPTAD